MSKSQHGSLHIIAILTLFSALLLLVFTSKINLKKTISSIFKPKIQTASATSTRAFILTGVNYTHYSNYNCNMNNTGLLYTYHQPGIRQTVQNQLSAMRLNGVQSLRLGLWHMHDPGPNQWGPIPSANGIVSEPYRTNLINYLTDVKKTGFIRLSVSLMPMWTNSPGQSCQNPNAGPGCYDPSLFTENWNFLQDVRSIATQYGPTDTRFDLISEAAPSNYQESHDIQSLSDYVKNIYTNYVNTYGKNDLTVSYIAPASSVDQGSRLQNLINIFNSSGLGQPNWFETHLDYTGPGALYGLQEANQVLTNNNLNQPLVIGEAAFNSTDVAQSIAQFIQSSTRQIDEVMYWPKTKSSAANCPESESAPYSTSEYSKTLQKGQISCNPPTVNVATGQLYTANITSNWKNLSSSGNPTTNVCVSLDNQPETLMSSGSGPTNTLSDNAPWINAPHDYQFNLYDQNGGTAPICGGSLISQCSIHSETSAISSDPIAAHGLLATYFDNADLTGTPVQKIDPVINFNWEDKSPDTNISADTFSARWQGFIKPQFSENYTISSTSDDGIKVWINNQLVIDLWQSQNESTASGSITLTAGQNYPIKVEYTENTGLADIRLYWSSPSTPLQIIPQSQLTPLVDNVNPTVSITSPTNGSTVKKNTTISINANASDNIAVSKVEFYVSGTLKCTDTSAPYTCNWLIPNKANTNYSLQAKAYDPSNNSATSTISVTAK